MRKTLFALVTCAPLIMALSAAAQKPPVIQARPVPADRPRLIVLTPAVPTNVSADGYSLIETQVAFQDNSTNEDGFEVEEKIGAGTSPSRRLPANSASASFMYAGPGVKACYRIRAYNKNGQSAWSNQVCATTGTYKEPPPSPTNLKAEKVSGSQINLTWFTQTMLRRIGGFVVEYRMVSTGVPYAKRATIRVTSIKPSGEIEVQCDGDVLCSAHSFNGVNLYPVRYSSPLTSGVTYCFRVLAFNNAGNSQYSNEACKTND